MPDAETELESAPRPPYLRPGALVGAIVPEATEGSASQGNPPPGAQSIRAPTEALHQHL